MQFGGQDFSKKSFAMKFGIVVDLFYPSFYSTAFINTIGEPRTFGGCHAAIAYFTKAALLQAAEPFVDIASSIVSKHSIRFAEVSYFVQMVDTVTQSSTATCRDGP